MKLNYEITVKHDFDAAHYLPRGPEKCRTIHGHRWEVEVTILRQEFDNIITHPDGTGMIVDFGGIKGIIDELDHTHLNIVLGENSLTNVGNPTAEVIATWLFHRVINDLGVNPSELSIEVWESPECSIKISLPSVSELFDLPSMTPDDLAEAYRAAHPASESIAKPSVVIGVDAAAPDGSFTVVGTKGTHPYTSLGQAITTGHGDVVEGQVTKTGRWSEFCQYQNAGMEKS